MTGTLIGIRWAGDDQADRPISKCWDQVEAIAVKNGTATFLDSDKA